MALRLVVCVRWRPPAAAGSVAAAAPEGTWSEVLRTLAERATALGGRIVGWQDGTLSVDFALDGLQDAVDFLVEEPSGSSLSRGLAHGELEACVESHRIALCTGEVLHLASALAEYARPGEALVTPELVAATGGELLTTGPPGQREGREPMAALSLDLVHPLRSLLVEAVGRITEPPWKDFPGLPAGPGELVPGPGEIALVRGAPGAGGTRFLEAMQAGREGALWLRPGRSGRPCDALAQALQAEGAHDVGELEALLRQAAPDLVVIDDADDVDADSLEIVGRARANGTFGLVLRLLPADAERGALHEGLGQLLPQGLPCAEYDLEPFGGADAAWLARAATGDALGAEEAAAIEAAGARGPLEVMEWVTYALDRGDWVWSERGVQGRSAAKLEVPSLDVALAARLDLLPPRVRLVLEGAAVLGGTLEGVELAQLFEAAASGSLAAGLELAERPLVADEVLGHLTELVARRWLRGAPFRVATATARRVILGHIGPERLRALHAGAARLGVQEGAWGRAAAAVHSAHIGRLAQARDLAKSAAPLVRESGSPRTADALAHLARDGELRDMRERRLFPVAAADAASDIVSEWPAGASRSPLPPPIEPSTAAAHADAGHGTAPGGAVGRSPFRSSRAPAGARENGPAVLGDTSLPSESDSLFPLHVAEALARRDPAPLLQMAQQVRARHQPLFAARLEALADLVQGDTGDALGRLRRARDDAREAPASEQCRAELALAIALAAAGRAQEALLGALQALARAREGEDARGERACARFLAQLARGFGDEAEAAQWEQLVAP